MGEHKKIFLGEQNRINLIVHCPTYWYVLGGLFCYAVLEAHIYNI